MELPWSHDARIGLVPSQLAAELGAADMTGPTGAAVGIAAARCFVSGILVIVRVLLLSAVGGVPRPRRLDPSNSSPNGPRQGGYDELVTPRSHIA